MTLLDVSVVALAVLGALVGVKRGFLVGACSLVGVLAGGFLGSWGAHTVLDGTAQARYAPVAGVAGGFVVALLLAVTASALGGRARRALHLPVLSRLDHVLGGVLFAAGGVLVAWALVVVGTGFPEAVAFRAEVQRSPIVRQLNELLPPAGPLLRAAQRFDPFPRFAGLPVGGDLDRPDRSVLLRPGIQRAAASVVRIEGEACGLGLTGSGWVVEPGVVVTNAHVVAGDDGVSVQAQGRGPELDARVVAVDATNDIAVLRVDGLTAPALAVSDRTGAGELRGATLGFPQDGPFDARPASIAAHATRVTADDAYGQGSVVREVLTFRGYVRPGNSGGPLTDIDGAVVGVVFARAEHASDGTAYAVPVDIAQADVAGAGDEAVGTGPCGTE